jgi:hypothetical protein
VLLTHSVELCSFIVVRLSKVQVQFKASQLYLKLRIGCGTHNDTHLLVAGLFGLYQPHVLRRLGNGFDVHRTFEASKQSSKVRVVHIFYQSNSPWLYSTNKITSTLIAFSIITCVCTRYEILPYLWLLVHLVSLA